MTATMESCSHRDILNTVVNSEGFSDALKGSCRFSKYMCMKGMVS
jgi:hypothetical protein